MPCHSASPGGAFPSDESDCLATPAHLMSFYGSRSRLSSEALVTWLQLYWIGPAGLGHRLHRRPVQRETGLAMPDQRVLDLAVQHVTDLQGREVLRGED